VSKKSKKKRARVVQKAAGRTLITKAAARFAASTAGMVECGQGHLNRPGGTVCTTCTDPMPGVPVPPMSMIGKSAFADEHWRKDLASSPDPEKREIYQQARYRANGGAA
jgi:hypothetical protein